MDDDLMSLRGGSQSNDDDLFGAFADPDDLGFDSPEPPPATTPGPNDFSFDNEFNFPDFDDPTLTLPATPQPESVTRAQSTSAAKPGKSIKKATRRSSKPRSRGMTPQQRMILAVFAFLDVAIIGFLILLVIGAIQL